MFEILTKPLGQNKRIFYRIGIFEAEHFLISEPNSRAILIKNSRAANREMYDAQSGARTSRRLIKCVK